MYIIIGSAVGASILLLATVISCLVIHKGKRRYYEKGGILSTIIYSIVIYLKRSNMILVYTLYRPHSFCPYGKAGFLEK
jgi:Na+/melibiose symporter-like transporter